jgi:hypothetical protein
VEGSTTTSRTSTFEFTGSDTVSQPQELTFECRLDSSNPLDFVPCPSGVSYSDLSYAQHTFEVRAVDEAGNKDGTPASRTWTVEKLTPTFSGLSSPTITYGTTPTTLSGTLSAGSQIPTGSVSITLNSVTHTAAINPADGSFSSSFTTDTLGVSDSPYSITYSYAGDVNFKGASDTSKTLTVQKAPPAFSNLGGPTIPFGATPTSLSGTIKAGSLVPTGNVSITLNGVTQLAAMNAATGYFSSSFATGALTVTPGSPYTITYSYAGDNNFNGAGPDTSKSVTVQKATPAFSNLSGPTIPFGATPTSLSGTIKAGSLVPTGNVSITLNGVTQLAAINAADGTFTFSFATGALTVTPGSPYTITYSYAGDNNFNGAGPDTSKSLTVQKATPAFSNLSGPTITFGATPTSLSGTIKAGSLVPTGNVSITLNGVTQLAAINAADGTFTFSFATVALSATPGTYTITYSYAGDNNFNGAGPDTSKSLTVQKATPAFSNLSGPTITFAAPPTSLSGTINAGSAVPIGNVSITLNGVTQLAAINAADGTFTSSFGTGTLTVTPGSPYTITYSYAGDNNFNGAGPDTSKRLTVTPRTGIVAYIGQTVVVTSGSSSTTGQVTLTASVESDAGDIANAKVTFTDMLTNKVLASGVKVSQVPNASVPTGTANTVVTLSTGQYGAQSYLVQVKLDTAAGSSYTNSGQLASSTSQAYATVTVMIPPTANSMQGSLGLPGLAGQPTCGISFTAACAPAGKYADATGASYSAGLQWNNKGTNPQGQIQLVLERADGTYYIKSNSITSVAFSNPVNGVNKNVTVYTKASIYKVTASGTTSIDGNVTLRMDAHDGGISSGDTVGFTVLSSKDSSLYYSNNWAFDSVSNSWKTMQQGISPASTAAVIN